MSAYSSIRWEEALWVGDFKTLKKFQERPLGGLILGNQELNLDWTSSQFIKGYSLLILGGG